MHNGASSEERFVMHDERGEWIGVDAENVLAEVIDDEVMILDMRLGNYYNLSGVAVAIWNALRQPRRLDDVVELVRRRYTQTPDDVAALVRRFVDELAAEQLVSRRAEAPLNGGTTPGADAAPAPEPQPFQAPRLEKYTDMQALLLVDPIHDVDVLGWPHVPKRS
jgi:hypothetical protein